MKFRYLITALFPLGLMAATPDYQAIGDELLAMMAQDQGVMKGEIKGEDKDQMFRRHQARVEEIVAQIGWPTIPLVGKKASQAAWLLVQHADQDKAFQQRMLALMAPLAEKGDIDGANYAYLYDRTHKPQRYGTQGGCQGDSFVPFEMEDPAGVEARRKAVGMMSFKDYADMASRHMCHRKP
ncbi:hypothetical protein PVT67_00960 [Gallaecimonas kandeliae]|uniref:DUF6624 domain-containing protein n=1 Tax=Gallaecimonas kandeliae TaxID=3029055 RepID=UPI002647118B|nr:DUF6624 domain-containing protein [Gallaecimonas kandeliae]WKE65858.1 hypothetical protein PVT67_00960 [Gallaecimonas kandeliae]